MWPKLILIGGLAIVLGGVGWRSAVNAQPDDAGIAPTEEIIRRWTGGGSRSDMLDMIERSEAERARQEKERVAREAEVRAILLDIDDKIFSIRLNIAEFRSERPNCRTVRQRDETLAAKAADLDRLRASATERCRAAGADRPTIAELCNGRMAQLDEEKAAIAAERAAADRTCSGAPRENQGPQP